MRDALRDLYVTVEDLIRSEFKNSEDIKSALKTINDAIKDFDEAVDVELDEAVKKLESRKIVKEKMKDEPILESLDDKYKDLIADLSIKYKKELPSDEEFKERIFRRIVDLSDETIMNLAYGRSTIESVGKSVGRGGNYEEGLKALRVDSFLPKNIETTYSNAIGNIYKHKGLFLSFLIDYFRN